MRLELKEVSISNFQSIQNAVIKINNRGIVIVKRKKRLWSKCIK